MYQAMYNKALHRNFVTLRFTKSGELGRWREEITAIDTAKDSEE